MSAFLNRSKIWVIVVSALLAWHIGMYGDFVTARFSTAAQLTKPADPTEPADHSDYTDHADLTDDPDNHFDNYSDNQSDPTNSTNPDEPVKLQTLVDSASPGDMILLDEGVYVGPVTIEQPISIEATGSVVIYSEGDDPILTIRTNQVSLSGIHFLDERERPMTAAIVVEGEGHVIDQVSIETNGTGIRLEGAHHNKLTQLVIDRPDTMSMNPAAAAQRGHGIDLWESNNNDISNSTIANKLDGIYLERSDANVIQNNVVTSSRYGYHFMFSDNNELIDNEAIHNISGAMVMGVKGSIVRGNTFKQNAQHVNALGLLLYNVSDTTVEHNDMHDNRIGMFVEFSHNNVISHNELARNFIGLQLFEAKDNTFELNTFIANVVQAQSKDSANNTVQFNYWDDLQGIDTKGEGYSAIPYRVQPFFIELVERVPAYQIFFASPSLQFLEQLLYSPDEGWFMDERPLMKPDTIAFSNDGVNHVATALCSVLLLLGSVYILIKSGVRKA